MRTFTKDDLKAAKERCEKATPGPWVIGVTMSHNWPVLRLLEMETNSPDEARLNAGFVEHARADLPLALAALEEAWEVIQYYAGTWTDNYRWDRTEYVCMRCGESKGDAHLESCIVGKTEAILRAAEEEQGE